MPGFVFNILSYFNCTGCGVLCYDMYEHPILKVAICKSCYDHMKVIKENGDKCLWCGHGKTMLCCVRCQSKCCVDCIVRNVGSDYIVTLNNNNWCCFVCDPGPIKKQLEEYMKIVLSSASTKIVSVSEESAQKMCLPTLPLDNNEASLKKENSPPQHLDLVLSFYQKQIQASLQMEGTNIPAIINEIDSITVSQLRVAINSYKKCLEAFASDLTNLESRIPDEEANSNHIAQEKLTSLLKVLAKHHIFNRICHAQARINDDDVVPGNNRKSFVPLKKTNSPGSISPGATRRADPVIQSQELLQPNKNNNKIVSTFKPIWNKGRKRKLSVMETAEDTEIDKRMKLSELDDKWHRRPRSLMSRSWLSDNNVEKENDGLESRKKGSESDSKSIDPATKTMIGTRKRGRPSKGQTITLKKYINTDIAAVEEGATKRGRGRPRKSL